MQTERVRIAESAWIASTARIGEPSRPGRAWDRLERTAAVGERCEVAHFCLIGEESTLGDDAILDAYCWIADGATVGDRVSLTDRASVGANVTIGADCVIGGATIAARSRIGAGCQVYGDLVHRRLDPSVPQAQDAAPVLEDGVFIGWGATVVGGITVGRGSYVCAGATVTKDVPAGLIVSGTNELHDPADWRGALAKSEFFATAVPPEPVAPRAPEQVPTSQSASADKPAVVELPKTPAAAARARERSRLED